MPPSFPSPRRTWLLALGLAALSGAAAAADAAPSLDAPNVVPITPRLVSAGQPTAAALGKLGAQGFGAVIYLAPPTSSDAVKGEAEIVRRQGLQFTNIPIEFNKPGAQDFADFEKAMAAAGDRKVLVHCQVNMRGSSMVFLHRAITGKEDPEVAYASVTKVWAPSGVWREFIVNTLRAHNVDFEPY
ncbi:MAG TPA: protein tyrosine phosphatase family protein [Ideonella sp.]|uniref:protein tyrosine phosphatase family protein n=1 Tax=Ideonella sp. TaxID=1929293 RepID=UPI002BAE47CA|nr:protein tyrosine phosphatase family protein [Ideonella sp.]HSI46941.1 protein tyrosine phosphatase family protein [Ideonella sp.]